MIFLLFGGKMKKYKIIKILQWIFFTSIASLVIAVLFRFYIGTPTVVKLDSMYPTLIPCEKLFINRWIRTTKKFQIEEIL